MSASNLFLGGWDGLFRMSRAGEKSPPKNIGVRKPCNHSFSFFQNAEKNDEKCTVIFNAIRCIDPCYSFD